MPTDNKTIEVSVKLWTDNIGPNGQVVTKHAWSIGVVHMKANGRHEISPMNPVPFNSFAELPGVIEKVLIAHGIKLHAGGRDKKLFQV